MTGARRRSPVEERLVSVWVRTPPIVLFLVVLGYYLVFTGGALWLHAWNPLWFMWIGERYAELQPDGRTGYDGQFIYYIAQDGMAAIPHLDNPPYRLQRILLPVLVWLFSLGNAGWMPWVLIAVNLAALLATTWMLAQWVAFQKLSVWYAAIYPLFVGTLLAYSRNLTEPVAFCLAALGFISWSRQRYLVAVVALASAALAKELALLFVLGLALSAAVQRQWKQTVLALTASLPLIFWDLYLWRLFHTVPITAGPALELIPLAGIVPHLTSEPGRLTALVSVGYPALFLLVVAAYGLTSKPAAAALWVLLLNCIVTVLLPIGVYDHIMHAGRNASGMVLATIFSLPVLAAPVRNFAFFVWVGPTPLWTLAILRHAPWLSLV